MAKCLNTLSLDGRVHMFTSLHWSNTHGYSTWLTECTWIYLGQSQTIWCLLRELFGYLEFCLSSQERCLHLPTIIKMFVWDFRILSILSRDNAAFCRSYMSTYRNCCLLSRVQKCLLQPACGQRCTKERITRSRFSRSQYFLTLINYI